MDITHIAPRQVMGDITQSYTEAGYGETVPDIKFDQSKSRLSLDIERRLNRVQFPLLSMGTVDHLGQEVLRRIV